VYLRDTANFHEIDDSIRGGAGRIRLPPGTDTTVKPPETTWLAAEIALETPPLALVTDSCTRRV
jgi:hypothetical protein